MWPIEFAKLHANVPMFQCVLHANVPKVCQLLIFICQRSNKHANVPNSMPIFQLGMLVCKTYVNVSYIEIVLYFIFILNFILKSVWNFSFFFFLFCSLVRNENTKQHGFYTLQVTRVFSNFSQLKQFDKKNMCEYCDLLKFWLDNFNGVNDACFSK